jgi:putative PIN family toxin of toxin-antitoxin system
VLVVLDTNVVISAFLNTHGTPALIVRLVLERKLSLCCNTAILSEYEDVAGRSKFASKIDQIQVRRFIDLLQKTAVSFTPIPSAIVLTDESDRVFYDTAKGSGAVLITGNTKHFPQGADIKTPAEFIAALGRSSS